MKRGERIFINFLYFKLFKMLLASQLRDCDAIRQSYQTQVED